MQNWIFSYRALNASIVPDSLKLYHHNCHIYIPTQQSFIKLHLCMYVCIYLGPPSITTHPRDVTIPQRTTTTLICSATGSETLMYSWERRSSSSWTTINNANSPLYVTDTTLNIGEYMYRCRVSNEAGSVVSNSATVNVYGEYCLNK